jgi:hypothetical protein
MERTIDPSHHAPGSDDLSPELQDYRRQFEDITRDARLLLAGLTDRQLAWRETRDRWSIADCFDHLVVTGQQSLPHIRQAMLEARARGALGRGPFRDRMLERWFVRSMDAPSTWKFKAPRAYRPSLSSPGRETVAGFFLLQQHLIEAVEEANGLDLAVVKVANPVTRWFRMSLGQEFALTAAHERRHVWQARGVLERQSSAQVPA